LHVAFSLMNGLYAMSVDEVTLCDTTHSVMYVVAAGLAIELTFSVGMQQHCL